MTMDKSLRMRKGLARNRSVLNRAERIARLQQADKWQEGSASPFGLPKVRVLLNPGKNITVICEVIAMNHLLKYSGFDPAERFNERLIKQMRDSSEVRAYLQEDYE